MSGITVLPSRTPEPDHAPRAADWDEMETALSLYKVQRLLEEAAEGLREAAGRVCGAPLEVIQSATVDTERLVDALRELRATTRP